VEKLTFVPNGMESVSSTCIPQIGSTHQATSTGGIHAMLASVDACSAVVALRNIQPRKYGGALWPKRHQQPEQKPYDARKKGHRNVRAAGPTLKISLCANKVSVCKAKKGESNEKA